MDTALKDLVGTECNVYVDVIVYSSSADEHARKLENILQRFDRANLQLHPGKCVFAEPQVQYLGFDMSQNDITSSPEKVKAVKQYPAPKNVKEVRSLLGLASFYRKLKPNFAEIAKPMTVLTRKRQEFIWEPKQQEAFQTMKDTLCTVPVLACPNFKLPL